MKIVRRLRTPLPGLTRKSATKNADTGWSQGPARRRQKSGFRVRLEEKQKVRWHYGISERQLRKAYERALAGAGPTGENLLGSLERRLDNVVFRLGFAPTIPAARQLVGHGHVLVDGKRIDRAGYRVSAGENVAVSERGRRIPDVVTAVERGPEVRLPSYLKVDPADPCRGHVTGQPERADVPFIVADSAIVEFYAR